MKILYVDLGTTLGGSLLSLEQLLGRLDRAAFQPVALLAARSPAISRMQAIGVPVRTVRTFTVAAARSTAVVRLVKQTVGAPRIRDGGILARFWVLARSIRDILTRTLPLTWRLYRAIRAVRPDLVHVNDAIFASRAAIAAAWLARIPTICHVRSLGEFTVWDHVWASTVRRFIYISEWVARDQVSQGIPAGRGRVIYNGIDPAPYATPLDRAAARRALDLPVERPIVAVIGRLVPWKGQDLFLRAMQRVRETIPNALGLVIGETEDFSRDFEDVLRTLVTQLGLAETVRFTGYMDQAPTVLAAIDVLAHTSLSPEPFGRVMIEAMAAGRPVVSPAEGGGREIVVDGRTGMLYEPRNADGLAAAVTRLLKNPETARTMGAAGRARVAELFTLDRCAGAVFALYRELEEDLA